MRSSTVLGFPFAIPLRRACRSQLLAWRWCRRRCSRVSQKGPATRAPRLQAVRSEIRVLLQSDERPGHGMAISRLARPILPQQVLYLNWRPDGSPRRTQAPPHDPKEPILTRCVSHREGTGPSRPRPNVDYGCGRGVAPTLGGSTG